ncbi:MAG: 2Fe-2S iron-sulfur cluster binding domain-containing protein [Rhodocyclaceae bacterium]|nr:MAG: 2Fe-2S iron-sulfur cluster binding domain-containing protein [Rhodocyclaceae bacterium]
MSHKIALNFEDGQTRFIASLPGENVANAAYRNAINIPIDCRDGACGACKSICESGQFEMTDFIETALSHEEVKTGHVLTCKMIPTTDCVVRIPTTLEQCVKVQLMPKQAVVVSIKPVSETTFTVTLEGEAVTDLEFLPGQYAALQVPGTTETRAYSFSSMVEDGRVEFLIRNVPGGLMSSYLSHRSKVGDSISMKGPIGSFYLRDIKRPVLMLAGGTGLAPFLAMLATIEEKGSAHPIHLVYGVTSESDLVMLDRLDEHKQKIPDFTYTACVADKTSNYPIRGYVTDHIPVASVNGGDVDIYLCGPPAMVSATEDYIKVNGIEPVSFHYEKFVASR